MMMARRVVRGQNFDLHYRLANTGESPRLGLMVPKRLAKAASLRNAIKRQGREAFRLMALEIVPCDLVLRLRHVVKNVNARDSVQLRAWRTELENLLRCLPRLSG